MPVCGVSMTGYQMLNLLQVVFLDHDKKCYKSDLKIVEQSGLLRSVRSSVINTGSTDS